VTSVGHRTDPFGSRVDPGSLEYAPEALRRAWSDVERLRGSVAGPYLFMLHSPEVAVPVAELSKALADGPSPSPDVYEVSVAAAARVRDCEFQWYHHSRRALAAGADRTSIAALAVGRVGEVAKRYRDVVALIVELERTHRVGDELFARLAADLGPEGVVRLLTGVGHALMLSTLLNAVGATAPDGRPFAVPESEAPS
jgi:alkylhydroperoxidase family enzyme